MRTMITLRGISPPPRMFEQYCATPRSYAIADVPWPVDDRSIYENALTPVVDGDVAEVSRTLPSNYVTTVRADGTVIIDRLGDASRQVLQANIYPLSRLDWGTEVPWYDGNHIPELIDSQSDIVYPLTLGVPMTPINLAALITDGDGDATPVTADSAYPTGMALFASVASGTPLVAGTFVIPHRATDLTGEYKSFNVTYLIGPLLVPDVVGESLSDAIDDLATAYLNAATVSAYSASVPVGYVISQYPTAGSQVSAFSTISLLISLGPSPGPASIRMRAFALGYIYEQFRNIGDEFEISDPLQYSPYWMTFVDTPPDDWLPALAVFSEYIDREMLEFGRPRS